MPLMKNGIACWVFVSLVMGLYFFLESVSVCLEELFEDVVDHIADTARLALRRQKYELNRPNELRLYADF